MDFKLTAYSSRIDALYKRNGKVFTEIGQLLAFINESAYWDLTSDDRVKEVSRNDNWDVRYNKLTEYNTVKGWDLEITPTDTNKRILGVSIFKSKSLSGTVYHDFSTLVEELGCDDSMPSESICMLYPYTMGEFIDMLVNWKPELIRLLNEFDLIAINNN